MLELHGSIYRNYCTRCHTFYLPETVRDSAGVPVCSCGGVIKPDVVLYEECLNEGVLEEAVWHISRADVLLVGGTSLAVYPAAGLLQYYSGKHLVLINNKSQTPADDSADLLLHESIGKALAPFCNE